MDPQIHQDLVDTARDEADRMNRLVGNLLNMTRLEAGALRVTRQPGDIQDAIGTALDNLEARLGIARFIRISKKISPGSHGFCLDRPGVGQSGG